MKKKYIYIGIIIVCLIVIISIYLINKEEKPVIKKFEILKKEDIDIGKTVNETDIDLNNYSENINIGEFNEYNITGNFENTLFIDGDETITLNINNVNIHSDLTSAIVNLSGNDLIINIIGDNYIADNGYSEYDACIYSYGNLIFNGDGNLNVDGMQFEGEGIATNNADITFNSGNYTIRSSDDSINAGGKMGGLITINNGNFYLDASGDGIDSNDRIIINDGLIFSIAEIAGNDTGLDSDNGIVINGGTIVSTGSKMMKELPLEESLQNTISFDFEEEIDYDELITLMDVNNNVIVSFVTKKRFTNLLISTPNLKYGNYVLYKGGSNTGELINDIYYNGEYEFGERIMINNSDGFTINSTITDITTPKD